MGFVFKMAFDVVNALEVLHKTCRTYNDMKPQNLMIKINESNEPRVYLIDFGFCQKFITPEGKHISSLQDTTSF